LEDVRSAYKQLYEKYNGDIPKINDKSITKLVHQINLKNEEYVIKLAPVRTQLFDSLQVEHAMYDYLSKLRK
jgi:hypothetical protein